MIAILKLTSYLNFERVFIWLDDKKNIILWVLFVSVLLSAILLSYQRHWSRNLHKSYQEEMQIANSLQVEWRQLLVEESTFNSATRVFSFAQKELNMTLPCIKKIKIINIESV